MWSGKKAAWQIAGNLKFSCKPVADNRQIFSCAILFPFPVQPPDV
jgi:hypothetical protein